MVEIFPRDFVDQLEQGAQAQQLSLLHKVPTEPTLASAVWTGGSKMALTTSIRIFGMLGILLVALYPLKVLSSHDLPNSGPFYLCVVSSGVPGLLYRMTQNPNRAQMQAVRSLNA